MATRCCMPPGKLVRKGVGIAAARPISLRTSAIRFVALNRRHALVPQAEARYFRTPSSTGTARIAGKRRHDPGRARMTGWPATATMPALAALRSPQPGEGRSSCRSRKGRRSRRNSRRATSRSMSESDCVRLSPCPKYFRTLSKRMAAIVLLNPVRDGGAAQTSPWRSATSIRRPASPIATMPAITVVVLTRSLAPAPS